jgi:hypothetical protein
MTALQSQPQVLVPSQTFAPILLGYDLPTSLPAIPECAIPDCSLPGQCWPLAFDSQALVQLSTEPATLSRRLLRWMDQMGLACNSIKDTVSIAYQAPPFGLFNSFLNQSSWVSSDLFCDSVFNKYIFPGLPPQFSFPTPAGMLSCLAFNIDVTIIDMGSSSLITPGTVSGFNPKSVLKDAVLLVLNGDALYGGNTPVPIGLLDGVSSSMLPFVSNYVSGTNYCGSTCQQRMSWHQPYIVNGVPEDCPPGSTGQKLNQCVKKCQ